MLKTASSQAVISIFVALIFGAVLLLAPATLAFAQTVAPVAVSATPATVNDTSVVIASTPEAVTAAKEDTSVTIEYGNFLNYAANTVSAILVPLILAILTATAAKLPGLAGLFAQRYIAKNGETLVDNLRDWGLNSVSGATKDKKLDFNVGSSVIASAVERVINLQNADAALKATIDKLGGAKGIAEKIFRSLNLDETATKENVLDAGLAKANRFPLNRG